MFRYCKLIKNTYEPSIREAPEGFLYPWIGSYNNRLVLDSPVLRIGVIIQTKSESIDMVHRWLNHYLIKKYKRTHLKCDVDVL